MANCGFAAMSDVVDWKEILNLFKAMPGQILLTSDAAIKARLRLTWFVRHFFMSILWQFLDMFQDASKLLYADVATEYFCLLLSGFNPSMRCFLNEKTLQRCCYPAWTAMLGCSENHAHGRRCRDGAAGGTRSHQRRVLIFDSHR